MTKQELQARIDKKNSDIAKIAKRIAKWGSGMTSAQIAVAKEYGYASYAHWQGKISDDKYNEAKKAYYDSDIPTRDYSDYNFNKGPNADELFRAESDMAEAEAQLAKYQASLDASANFDNMEKIAVIWTFLQNWRAFAHDYYIENARLFAELNERKEAAWAEYKTTDEFKKALESGNLYRGYFSEYEIEQRWKMGYYSEISQFTKDICSWSGKVDVEKLDKTLDAEVVAKYRDLVARITEKAGGFKTAEGLSIGPKGDINGYVDGTLGRVHVETIGAGGYNTDRIVNVKRGPIYHYRTLVNAVKGGKRAVNG